MTWSRSIGARLASAWRCRAASIRDLCRIAFAHVSLDWEEHVKVDPAFLRPADVDVTVGDATRARKRLGWVPEISLEQMIAEMVEADLRRLRTRMQD